MKNTPQQLHEFHTPVLLTQALYVLAPKCGESYLDLTAGYGGHAREVLSRTGAYEESVLVDRDLNAISVLSAEFGAQGTRILHSDFLAAAELLTTEITGSKDQANEGFNLILMDIGVSSPQLDQGERGFSFSKPGPLDMRMDASQGESAADLVARLSENDLAQLIERYGEETSHRSVLIAIALKRARPQTTTEAAAVIEHILPREKAGRYGRASRIHPATRTFQALRIAVNDELGQLEKTLVYLPRLLAPGGRVAVISFHSLEDRIVKRFFQDQMAAGYEAELEILTKKPIMAEPHELENNPRARSAKLRAAAKIKK